MRFSKALGSVALREPTEFPSGMFVYFHVKALFPFVKGFLPSKGRVGCRVPSRNGKIDRKRADGKFSMVYGRFPNMACNFPLRDEKSDDFPRKAGFPNVPLILVHAALVYTLHVVY